MAPIWNLQPSSPIKRTDLHNQFGGRTQGDISPSNVSPNVMIFSDAKSGHKHGYTDGWQSDGCFHYTGEGQKGDQQMISGNKAVLQHSSHGRALRVFRGARGIVQYIGEFSVDSKVPYYETDAPESGGGPIRKVIVFRLRPIDIQASKPISDLPILPSQDLIEEIDIEANSTEKSVIDPTREPYEAERRESKLVQAFREYWEKQGVKIHRQKILPAGEAKPLYTDTYISDLNILVEAKGSTERGAIRMALGQLIDYGRFFPTAKRALLLPSKPRQDLIELIRSANVDLFWQENSTFAFEKLRSDI